MRVTIIGAEISSGEFSALCHDLEQKTNSALKALERSGQEVVGPVSVSLLARTGVAAITYRAKGHQVSRAMRPAEFPEMAEAD
jgi:hypothetical protein